MEQELTAENFIRYVEYNLKTLEEERLDIIRQKLEQYTSNESKREVLFEKIKTYICNIPEESLSFFINNEKFLNIAPTFNLILTEQDPDTFPYINDNGELEDKAKKFKLDTEFLKNKIEDYLQDHRTRVVVAYLENSTKPIEHARGKIVGLQNIGIEGVPILTPTDIDDILNAIFDTKDDPIPVFSDSKKLLT